MEYLEDAFLLKNVINEISKGHKVLILFIRHLREIRGFLCPFKNFRIITVLNHTKARDRPPSIRWRTFYVYTQHDNVYSLSTSSEICQL